MPGELCPCCSLYAIEDEEARPLADPTHQNSRSGFCNRPGQHLQGLSRCHPRVVPLEETHQEMPQTIGGKHILCSRRREGRVEVDEYLRACRVYLLWKDLTSSIVLLLRKRTLLILSKSTLSDSTLSFSCRLSTPSRRMTPRLICSYSSMEHADTPPTRTVWSFAREAACCSLPIIRSLKSVRESI